eukprot:TRINITY_DN31335_c0_g1_i1.p1 TRINITY_DN31335_c0_g1~~TRINITY_DN31335_c0_g1_i1.p1  ORF type:complete len:266 (-),score=94.94 TRINITY_DN31335_c0_g1_i1:47-844(-)
MTGGTLPSLLSKSIRRLASATQRSPAAALRCPVRTLATDSSTIDSSSASSKQPIDPKSTVNALLADIGKAATIKAASQAAASKKASAAAPADELLSMVERNATAPAAAAPKKTHANTQELLALLAAPAPKVTRPSPLGNMTGVRKSADGLLLLPVLYIRQSLNNTMFTLTDHRGQVICNRTCGHSGLTGARRSGWYAAEITGRDFGQMMRKKNVSLCRVVVKSKLNKVVRSGLKGVELQGVRMTSVTSRIPVPHNGMRLRKARRV